MKKHASDRGLQRRTSGCSHSAWHLLYSFDNYHLQHNPGLLSWYRAGFPTTEDTSEVKCTTEGATSFWCITGAELWAASASSQGCSSLSPQHHSLSRAQAQLLTVPEQQMLMMPVQMLANSMSRSYETVLAAVKDTEGTLLQLQLPLVNDWVKRNHLERKWKQQADCQGEMWGQRGRGGGVLYPRQNAIETAGREHASGTSLSSSKAWLCGCSRSQGTALLIVWLFIISAHHRLRVELPKHSIFTFWNILLIPEP